MYVVNCNKLIKRLPKCKPRIEFEMRNKPPTGQ